MIIDRDKDLYHVENFLKENEYIAFDIETTGLEPLRDKIIGFGFSNAESGIYIAHLIWDGNGLVTKVSYEKFRQMIHLVKFKKWVAWNGSFETRFCRRFFDVDLAPSMWCEGMLSKHTVEEEGLFKLKPLANKVFGEGAVEEQLDLKKSISANGGDPEKDMYLADYKILGKYCIKDCLLTFRLNEMYLRKIQEQGLSKFYFEDEVMPLYRTALIDMEYKGVQVDVELLSKYSKEIAEDITTFENQLYPKIDVWVNKFKDWYYNKHFPPKPSGGFAQYLCQLKNIELPKTKTGKFSLGKSLVETLPSSVYKQFLLRNGELNKEDIRKIQDMWWEDRGEGRIFNLKSRDHLKTLFFKILEEKPISFTKKKKPQMDKLTLMNLSNKYEWCNDLIVYNNLLKKQSTYIDNYLQNSINGVFYPGWFMHSTTSGRFGGNLMQLPRKIKKGKEHPLIEKYNNVIRDSIIAGEGRDLVGADYKSLEVVVFADDSNDPKLLDIIRKGEDFYSKVHMDSNNLNHKYSALEGDDNYFKDLEPELRQDTKPYGLGLRYGMQAFKLSKILNISQEKAQDIINKYFTAYSNLKPRMEELTNFALSNGYVKSKGGRIRHLSKLKKLHYSYGDMLGDSLEIWKKYHDCPKKYESMKYLGRLYRSSINNCLNFPIQSMAATITNRACIAIYREFQRVGIDAHICMQIHDEIVVSCKKQDTKRVKKIMQFLMENTTKLKVPLSAVPQVGSKYGDIK